jgi:hypothetical protein
MLYLRRIFYEEKVMSASDGTPRERKNQRIRELNAEYLRVSMQIVVFDQDTPFQLMRAGADTKRHAQVLREREIEKGKLLARLEEIRNDPDYVPPEPYGAHLGDS